MSLAPVVLFVYNRPDHTEKTLNALNGCTLASESEMFVFCDNYKKEKDIENVMKVQECVEDFSVDSEFKKVHVIKAEKNKGLAKSIIEGVSDIINKYGKVIVLEDDLEVSKDFLEYMNGALDYYENKESIWAISGYTFPMKALESYPHDVYLCGRGCSWGWATWKKEWDSVDWDVSDYDAFKFNLKKRSEFAKWGKDLPTMLDAYMYGEIHSWAIRWCYSGFKQGKYTIYPKNSKIKNHGTDGSGTNFNNVETRYDTELCEGKYSFVFDELDIDKKIQKEFASKYMTWMESLKSKLRWFLIKVNLRKL